MVTLKSSELRPDMIVWCHGMRCLIDDDVKQGPGPYGEVFWTSARILNRAEVSADSVPYSFTRRDGAGNYRWSIQGNDNARWAVEPR
jgi:hypothetical protein